MKHSIKPALLAALLPVILLIISGCASKDQTLPLITRSGFCFDTLITVSIYDSDDESILDECFDICESYDGLLSMTVSSSDISGINASNGESVKVSPETLELISYAYDRYEDTDGLFDISTAPLSSLWTQAREEGEGPNPDKVEDLLPHVGLDKISFDKDSLTVSKSDEDAGLDLGALGKGYVADRLKSFLISKGVRSAVISLGGNIVTIGSKPDGSPFTIGIKKPFSDEGEIFSALSVSDLSVVTSGVYERYFISDGKLYHHILDPRTGYPVDTDLCSATVISTSSLDGDALSTICLLLGSSDALKLIDSTPGAEAVFITKDYELLCTGGAEKYMK